MDELGFTPIGKEVREEIATHKKISIWRHSSAKKNSINVRTSERIENGTYIFREPSLFSVDKPDPAKLYGAYLACARAEDVVDWYDDLPYDSDRKTALVGEIETFIRDHPDKAALCTELNGNVEDAAKAIAIFERHAKLRPDTNTHDVLRMISWIRYKNNHCNAVLSYDSVRDLWTVQTIEDIEKGEAILFKNL